MGYGRLGQSEPGGSSRIDQLDGATSLPQPPPPTRNKRKIILLSVLSIVLIVISVVSAVLLVGLRARAGQPGSLLARKPTQAISKTCSKTLYPSLCVNSLMEFPGSITASEQDLVHISFNMTLQHFAKALYDTTGISYLQMDPHVRSAFDDCLELLDDSVDALSRSLGVVASLPGGANGGNYKAFNGEDVMTWLSTALTNQDTCTDGFEDVNGDVKNQMAMKLKDLSELVSNCLAIFSATDSDDFWGVPIQNKRRLLWEEDGDISGQNGENFPIWLGRRERRLLSLPVSAINADIIVSKDGNGTVKTITEAIKKAPENSDRRTIIYVKAGKYEESNLKVGRKKKNLMFIGDGKGKTVISGGKNVKEGMTTFHTASFGSFPFHLFFL